MFLNVFFLLLVLMAFLFSGADPLWQFGRGSSKKHFCEIILKSPYWPWRRCCLTVVFLLLLFFFFFCFGGHFVQQSRIILAILVEGHPRNISVKLF